MACVKAASWPMSHARLYSGLVGGPRALSAGPFDCSEDKKRVRVHAMRAGVYVRVCLARIVGYQY